MSFNSVTLQHAIMAYTVASHTTEATADTLVTLNSDKKVMIITNSFNQEVMLTFSAVAKFFLPAGEGLAIDLGPSRMQFASGIVIGVYNLGTQPTSGNLGITLA